MIIGFGVKTTFINFLGESILLVEENGVHRENHRLATGKLYHIMLYRLGEIRTHSVRGDRY